MRKVKRIKRYQWYYLLGLTVRHLIDKNPQIKAKIIQAHTIMVMTFHGRAQRINGTHLS